MLTVKKVTSGTAGGYADYLEGKTVASQLGDYYLKDGERVEAPGRWVQGAAVVGADPRRRVDGRVLRELMAVRHPGSGEPLRQAGASGEKVAALDATFSAPKSVSAVWAVADPQLRRRIELAHETAIDRALAYASQEVPLARQRVDRQTVKHIRVAALVATSWRHTTARAVDGHPPDPQLHSHVLIHAALRRDGKLVAVDSRALLTHRRELGAAYRSELARELTGLGFAIERGTGQGGRYFEIDGVPQLLLDIWSSRSRQVQRAIRERLERTGRDTLTVAEKRLLVTSSRAGKQPATTAELDRHWHQTAERYYFGPVERAELRNLQPLPLAPARAVTVAGALTEFDATFTRTQARAVALEQNAGLPIRDALRALDELREHGALLTLQDGHLTTRRHREAELQTVASINHAAAARKPPLPAELVDAEAGRLDQRLHEAGGALSAEQQHALRLATADRQLVVIEGQAGSGKSTILQAVARAHHDAGRELIVTSTSALAAERLADELAQAGVATKAMSTAALNQAIGSGRVELQPTTTVIHDEAALASTRELQPLLAAVEQAGARLILVGDPHQNQPVGAGGLWPYIEAATRHADAHAALSGNVRTQNPDDRRDQALFRAGEHQAAIAGYAARGHVHIALDQQAAEDAALEAAHSDRLDGLRTVVIVQTSNQQLDELNARAQAIRRQDGELGAEGLAVPGRPYELHPDDDVQVRQTLQTGDTGWVRNGTSGTVVTVDPERGTVRLRLADARDLDLTQDQLAEADIRLAYVQHPFPAQGITTDTAHLIAGAHATGAGSYVALTRARRRTDIYASEETLEPDPEHDTIAKLAARIGALEPELASIEQPVQHEHARTPAMTRPGTAEPEREAQQADSLERADDTGRGMTWEM